MNRLLPKLTYIALCLTATSNIAQAGSEFSEAFDNPTHPKAVWLNAGFYTLHFDHDKGLRNANPGLGLEWALNDTYALTAGGFKNSDHQHSNYLGMYVMPWRWKSFKLGAVVGTFDGYPRANQGGWFPALVPMVSFEGERWGLNTAIIPSVMDKLNGGISFQLKYKLTP
jgi:hypothetical protein